jgi:hypothetical protein
MAKPKTGAGSSRYYPFVAKLPLKDQTHFRHKKHKVHSSLGGWICFL